MGSNHRPIRSVIERLEEKIDRSPGPGACWPWLAGHSRSGYREVDYPAIHFRRPRGGKIMFRVNRLILILKHAGEHEINAGETIEAWIERVNASHAHLEGSHVCDRSGCCNPDHLIWQSHEENIEDQRERRARRRA